MAIREICENLREKYSGFASYPVWTQSLFGIHLELNNLHKHEIIMTYAELKTKYNQVFDFIGKSRVKDALDTLRYLCNHGRNLDLRTRLDDHTETYLNMLKYSFELSDDPQKELVYNRLIKAIIGLADDVKEDIIRSGNLLRYYKLKTIPESQSEQAIVEINRLMDRLTLLRESKEGNEESEAVSKAFESAEYKEKINMLFQIIWHADKLKDTEIIATKKVKPARYNCMV